MHVWMFLVPFYSSQLSYLPLSPDSPSYIPAGHCFEPASPSRRAFWVVPGSAPSHSTLKPSLPFIFGWQTLAVLPDSAVREKGDVFLQNFITGTFPKTSAGVPQNILILVEPSGTRWWCRASSCCCGRAREVQGLLMAAWVTFCSRARRTCCCLRCSRAPRLSRPYQVAPGQLMGRQQRAREGGKVVLCVARKMYFVLLKLALHFFQAKYMKILLK